VEGYMQELDTINFRRDEFPHLSEGILEETRVKAMLYMVFYDIVLSPNQVIDSLVVRGKLFEPSIQTPLPFQCYLDTTVIRSNNPFMQQLLLLLRREGDSAFIFSSIANGQEKARIWGSLIEKNPQIGDEDLLSEAENHYKDVIEWAAELDNYSSKVVIKAYDQQASFETLLTDYVYNQLGPLQFMNVDIPKNRSQGYQSLVSSQLPSQEASNGKEALDFISNLQNALGTRAKLIVPTDSHLIFQTQARDRLAYVSLDIDGLLNKHPEIDFALRESSFARISEALKESRNEVELAWKSIGNERESLKHFTEGLKLFSRNVVERDIPTESIQITYKHQDPTLGEAGISVPVPRGFTDRLFRRNKFRGIGKFINFR
jgi:hypothetical protein